MYFYSIGKSNDFVAEEKAKSLGYLMAGYEDSPLKKALVQTGLANNISIDSMLRLDAVYMFENNKEELNILKSY